MPNQPNHPVRAPQSLESKTPAGVVGNSAFGLSHMPTLPRPQTSVIIPPHPSNHLEERLRVIPVRDDDND